MDHRIERPKTTRFDKEEEHETYDPRSEEAAEPADHDPLRGSEAQTAAVSVSAPGGRGTFFDAYRSERDSVRTQELAYLDAIVAQGGDESTLSDAQKQKMTLVSCMESELNTENLIRAKGFEEVIVSMHNGSVNVIVDADALTDEQVAQILDIVLRETGETAENIKVSTAQ